MANIVKAHILGAEDGAVDAAGRPACAAFRDAAGRSTQLPEDSWDYNKTGANEPPYNLPACRAVLQHGAGRDALCVFLEINTWHYRCARA